MFWIANLFFCLFPARTVREKRLCKSNGFSLDLIAFRGKEKVVLFLRVAEIDSGCAGLLILKKGCGFVCLVYVEAGSGF